METTYIAFVGWRCIESGSLEAVLRRCKKDHQKEQPLIFEQQTGKQVDFDFRGSIEEVLDRAIARPARIGPGRPKLGVTSREISLLPRHWEWLEAQANGASAALRRLVDDARKRDPDEAQLRTAIDATGRFMTALAGNLPGFEEAYRALYARDRARLDELTKDWPQDVRSYVLGRLAS